MKCPQIQQRQQSWSRNKLQGLANIDKPFAQSLLPEFLIYWRDTNQLHSSWNTRFLQHVKQRWAKRHAQVDQLSRSTRDLSLAEQLNDTSWAQ